MKKISILSVVLIMLFNSCIYFSDRIRPMLFVYNNTDVNMYVLFTDKESLQMSPMLKLYAKEHYQYEDELGNRKDTVIYPQSRIESHSYTCFYDDGVHVSGKFKPFPDLNYVNFFFIKESTLKNYTWEEIVAKQMYEKKVRYTYDQLEEMNYEISYNP